MSLYQTTKGAAAQEMRRKAGFTLVELLAAILVSSIILVVLMESLNQATSSWLGQSKDFSPQREARSGLRLLADDLACLVALPQGPTKAGGDGRTRFFVDGPDDEFGSSRIAFLRASKPEPVDATQPVRGDLRLVLYGTALTQDGGASSPDDGKLSQKLMRRVLSAEETFQRIKAHLESTDTAIPLVSPGDWDGLASGDVATEAVAYDVIRFEVRPWESRPAPNDIPPSDWTDSVVPAWADVTLRVTNRPTSIMLNTAEDWMGRGAETVALTNQTPANYDDDREVRTYAMRLRFNPATP